MDVATYKQAVREIEHARWDIGAVASSTGITGADMDTLTATVSYRTIVAAQEALAWYQSSAMGYGERTHEKASASRPL